MTVEERAAALLRYLSGLTWAEYDRRALAIVAAAFREAEAAAAAKQREVVLALIRTSRASWDRCPDPDERSAVQAALDVLALAVRSAAGELLGPAAGGGGAGGG
jgi:hypothetical protein